VRPRWSWCLGVGLATAGWVSLMSWLGRDLNCYIDNCTPQAVLWWLGPSVIPLVATTAITRRMGRISVRSLGALAATSTIPGVLAWASWLYGLNPEDRFEAVLGALCSRSWGFPLSLSSFSLSPSQSRHCGRGRRPPIPPGPPTVATSDKFVSVGIKRFGRRRMEA
jgi:hypothetical protein